MVNLLMLFSHHHKILQGHHHFWLVTACLFYSKLAHALFQAQNGTVEFYKDSIELDRMVFHSDESSRIVHIGPEEVRWPESTLCVCVCVCVYVCVCACVMHVPVYFIDLGGDFLTLLNLIKNWVLLLFCTCHSRFGDVKLKHWKEGKTWGSAYEKSISDTDNLQNFN